MNKKPFLIALVGPTGIGKTALAIKLARHFNTEIISADSRQFYREMSIGTAIPSAEELDVVKHHFIQHKSIETPYNVGDFEKEALALLERLFKKYDPVILVGGSGLYTDALIKGLDVFPEADPQIRISLNAELESSGIETLQKELKEKDPEYFKRVDKDNSHRLIRALEICRASGKPYSSFLKTKPHLRPFETLKIGLIAPREIIYQRINQRVDIMIEQGLIDEAKALYPKRHLNALKTVGYRELFSYFDGDLSLETAINQIKINTRRYAKRQLTWYRKDTQLNWFDYKTPSAQIISSIKAITG